MKSIAKSPSMRALSVALALSVAGTTGAAFAQQGPGPGPQHKQQQQQQRPQQRPQQQKPPQRQQYQQRHRERPQFRWQDSREVRNYYRKNKMRHYKPLPPGVRFRVGYRRPPNVVYYDVPPVLLRRLPAYPGYRYYMAGDDIILVAIATGIIVDILMHVDRY